MTIQEKHPWKLDPKDAAESWKTDLPESTFSAIMTYIQYRGKASTAPDNEKFTVLEQFFVVNRLCDGTPHITSTGIAWRTTDDGKNLSETARFARFFIAAAFDWMLHRGMMVEEKPKPRPPQP